MTFFLGLGAGALVATEVGIPNSALVPSGKAAANASALPAKWKLVSGDKKNCIKWAGSGERGSELTHVAISHGVMLSTHFTVPALTEKEKKVKGEWSGLLTLDSLGKMGSGTGAWKVEISSMDGGEKIAVMTGLVRYLSNPKSPRVTRSWLEIPEATMRRLTGEKWEIRITASSNTPVIISGVSLSRLHSLPTRRLLGKSNGGKGPDLLGAGSLGFDAMSEHHQNVLTVFAVRKGSPSFKAGLKAGDKIIGINKKPLFLNNLNPGWAWFYHSHEALLGRAVLAAWSAKPPLGRGVVRLVVLREGKPESITCKLSQPMGFKNMLTSKNKDILHGQMIDFLCENQRPDGSWRGAIRTTFSALALLATQDPAHAPRIKKAVDWMLNKYPEPEKFGNLGFWHGSYAGILYCEYYLATGDGRVLPRIASVLDWIRSGTHTSKWGMPCLGHGISGLPYGQKALVAPAVHALVLDSLAEKCSIESGLWDTLLPYMVHSWSDPSQKGHGSLGYNAAFKDKGQFWSRSGLFAMAAHLRGERADMESAMIGFMRGHYPWFRNSHAYGEPGGSIGLLALNLCEPDAYREVMNAYSWWFALAWEPGYGLRFTTPHMGAPYMGTEDLINATYALVFAAPKKSLFITGGERRNWLDVSSLDTPLSQVIIRRGKAGRITLACQIPGPQIHYTLDGSEPTRTAPAYTAPIAFPQGGMLKARAIDSSNKLGEITTGNYGVAKVGWKVITASGHKDAAEALRRASYAIDHSRTHSWLTDVGQDAGAYPHYLVIDLGQVTELSAVTVEFSRDRSAPKQCTLKASTTLKMKPRTVAKETWDAYQAVRRIKLDHPASVRYLRLEFTDPVKEGGVSLSIREIDIE